MSYDQTAGAISACRENQRREKRKIEGENSLADEKRVGNTSRVCQRVDLCFVPSELLRLSATSWNSHWYLRINQSESWKRFVQSTDFFDVHLNSAAHLTAISISSLIKGWGESWLRQIIMDAIYVLCSQAQATRLKASNEPSKFTSNDINLWFRRWKQREKERDSTKERD